MRLTWVALLVAVVIAAAGSGFERTAEAAPSLILSPDSGDVPSESGSISGTGWECSPGVAPFGTANVAGVGVSGSATIGRDGNLSGDFTATGAPDTSVDVSVTADTPCPGIVPVYLHATAVFTFDDIAPTPTRTFTPTTAPSSTIPVPTSTLAPPPATETPALPPPASTPPPPTPAAAPSATPAATASPTPTVMPGPVGRPGMQTAAFAGCVPSSPIELVFTPLNILGLEPPSDAATGRDIGVPAVQKGGDTRIFSFEPPSSEPGRLFRVSPKSDGAECMVDQQDAGHYWIAGQNLVVPMTLFGHTDLHLCAVGDKNPCVYPVVKGVFVERQGPSSDAEHSEVLAAPDAWVTDKDFYAEDLKKAKSRFRSSTDVTEAGPARLQASILPYPQAVEDDPLSPPGLVASWDVDCVNCEFTVDLSVLAPVEPPKKKAWYTKVFEFVIDVIKLPFQLIWSGFTWLGDLVGVGGDSSGAVKANEVLTETMPGEHVTETATAKLLQPTTYYFRLLPLGDDNAALGAPSNPVRMQQVDKPPDIKIPNPTPTVPVVYPYEVEILSYHGIIPPQVPNKICYIATEDAWPADMFGWTYTTNPGNAAQSVALPVKKGQPICEPSPKQHSIIDAILSWAEYTVNWASGAWKDLKKFAVDVILKYTPLGLQCGVAESAGAIPAGACASAFAIALDAALVSLGIPPDIPNFDELMDQGVEYLAAQIAAQVAIPPDVVEAAVAQGGPYAGLALSIAEEKLRESLQDEIEAKLGDAAKNIGLGYAASVAWVPDGIPVRPDDYQPPGMVLRVTRKPGVPGGDAGCTVRVSDSLQLSQAAVSNPEPGYESFVKNLPYALTALTPYDLFSNDADLANQGSPSGADKMLSVPPLEAGKSHTIPLTFKPNYYKSGWSPIGSVPVNDYIAVWRYLHDFGTIQLDAYGSCGGDTMKAPAKATLLALEIAGQ